jgi:hypothetical protein
MGNTCAKIDNRQNYDKRKKINEKHDSVNNLIDKKNIYGDAFEKYLREKKERENRVIILEDKYEGDLVDGKRNGKGICVYANMCRYEGEWKNNRRNGYGIYMNENGDKYEGEWKDDYANGKGIILYKNCDCIRYEGEMQNDTINGNGKMIYANGDIYEGDFVDFVKCGKGVFTYHNNGDKYDGEWKDDKKNGNGKMIYVNGDIYEGEWEDNKYNGCGKMIYANKDKYYGEWKDGQKNGDGKMIYVNGDVYDGNWKDDKRDDYGIFICHNNDRYEGHWKNDKKSDYGKMLYVNDNGDIDIYEGEWEDDKKNGDGIFTSSKGLQYTGKWKNDKKVQFEEKSIIKNLDGDSYEGYMIDMIMIGYCVINYKNENIYKGEIKDLMPNGYGMMILSESNDVKVGMWELGKLTDNKIKFPECGICQVASEPRDLVLACGNCNNLICTICRDKHYNLGKSGFHVGKSKIICPFCRKFPQSYIFKLPEKLITIMTKDDVCGKCKYCHDYDELEKIDITCNEFGEDAGNFICDKCTIFEGVKKCPECNVRISKNGGCNHMTCRQCHHEWCWQCGGRWRQNHMCRQNNIYPPGLSFDNMYLYVSQDDE